MRISVSDLAAALDAEVAGDGAMMVTGASDPELAGPDDLAVALSPRLVASLATGRARAAVVPRDTDWAAQGLSAAILMPVDRLTLSRVTAAIDPRHGDTGTIHPMACIAEGAEVASGTSVGPFAVIEAGARIGPDGVIGAGTFVGAGAVIGAGARIAPQVRIAPGVRLGQRVRVQPGATIGFDGFSFVTEHPSNAEHARAALGQVAEPRVQPWHRVHSLGGVVIGDDVEIGANTCVDAGTLRPTRIGDATKIDNLCMIGHNVEIGCHCLFAAMCGIAGSARIGDHVILGGKVGVSDHVTLGDCVVAGGGSVILSNVPAGRVVLGYPAQRMEQALASYRQVRRLPRLVTLLSGLQKAVSKTGQND